MDGRLPAGIPAVEMVIDFASPVPYEEFYAQFGVTGADVVRLRYTGHTSGELVNGESLPFPGPSRRVLTGRPSLHRWTIGTGHR